MTVRCPRPVPGCKTQKCLQPCGASLAAVRSALHTPPIMRHAQHLSQTAAACHTSLSLTAFHQATHAACPHCGSAPTCRSGGLPPLPLHTAAQTRTRRRGCAGNAAGHSIASSGRPPQEACTVSTYVRYMVQLRSRQAGCPAPRRQPQQPPRLAPAAQPGVPVCRKASAPARSRTQPGRRCGSLARPAARPCNLAMLRAVARARGRARRRSPPLAQQQPRKRLRGPARRAVLPRGHHHRHAVEHGQPERQRRGRRAARAGRVQRVHVLDPLERRGVRGGLARQAATRGGLPRRAGAPGAAARLQCQHPARAAPRASGTARSAALPRACAAPHTTHPTTAVAFKSRPPTSPPQQCPHFEPWPSGQRPPHTAPPPSSARPGRVGTHRMTLFQLASNA